ncbi:MAG: TlpA family protein disulfide reductase [Clostridioides sp.]|jgi:thiol-disulfide isomerase/thioredoxin|nr:TlpA family protein disulfide reductase [Clostridioides sp.]
MKSTKKILSVLILSGALLGLVACSSNDKKESATDSNTVTQESSKEASISKGSDFPKFDAKDIVSEEAVKSDIFKDSKVTVVNVWGTYCTGCIEEMPYLGELNNEYKDKGVQFLGIVGDAKGNEVDAVKIIKSTKVNYKNVAPDDTLQNQLINNIDAIPVTILVDKDGKVIDEFIVGSRTKDEYKKIIDQALEQVK